MEFASLKYNRNTVEIYGNTIEIQWKYDGNSWKFIEI